ncbi:hypothetical protein L218DRAFT_1009443 [Marasmius fiardii PR-910]|nr:hypothetical protein L218DRAFT_1009443 [Marasmius fiardii PR-910]
MFSVNDRKTSYKVPPAQVTTTSSSQQARREKALEDQKRRRAQKVDLSRQLDGFADLNLIGSDEEGEEESNASSVKVVHGGIASFTSAFEPNQASHISPAPSLSALLEPNPATASSGPSNVNSRKRGKRKRTTRVGKSNNQKWADKCMYAELLEMNDVDGWGVQGDGLPEDIETGWVSVGPVPVGKRCLAISRDSSGNGVEPNTTLRSRLQGKPLLPWFPSNLPPDTVLDCILDENWKYNGILHVLDVLQWKGRDIADCETPFRFWWRDTRVAELPPVPPPTSADNPFQSYQFPYPTTLLPIPYNLDTSFHSLLNSIIPSARSVRPVEVGIPERPDGSQAGGSSFQQRSFVTFKTHIASDGLLLYVAEATYESGTSPLSSWVPIRRYDGANGGDAMQTTLDVDQSLVGSGPLDTFEKLIRRRAEQKGLSTVTEDADMI